MERIALAHDQAAADGRVPPPAPSPRHPLGCDGGFAYVVGKREEDTMTVAERLGQFERRNRRRRAASDGNGGPAAQAAFGAGDGQ